MYGIGGLVKSGFLPEHEHSSRETATVASWGGQTNDKDLTKMTSRGWYINLHVLYQANLRLPLDLKPSEILLKIMHCTSLVLKLLHCSNSKMCQ